MCIFFFLGSYDMDNIKAVKWGREHEHEGIKSLEEAQNCIVSPSGLWLDECGFLGASPDGLVGENAIVEVKCPYKYREASILDGIKHDRSYIVTSDNNGEITINSVHEYYWQIQGQLAITKRQKCHLVLWTPKEVIIMDILAEDFSNEISALKNFYLNHYLKYLAGEKYVS